MSFAYYSDGKESYQGDCKTAHASYTPGRLLGADWRDLATADLSTKKPLPKYLQNIPGENGFFASYFDFTGLKQALAGALAGPSAEHTKKPTKTRLLASHAGNTDSCASANDMYCNDKTKKSYSKYGSDECDENTDTTDCGGMLAGSNCLAGECCCSKDAVAEVTYNGVITTEAAPAWTESFATSDYCYSSKCRTNFPVKCVSSSDCSGNKIDKDWSTPACTSVDNMAYGATLTCTDGTDSRITAKVGAVCYDDNYEIIPCTGDDGKCGNGYAFDSTGIADVCNEDDQMGGCKLCCGFKKQDVCSGNKYENENSATAFAWVGKLVMYAALLVLVGISPAILSAVGKLKGTDANGNSPLENICGTLSIFSVGCCGVLGAGFVAAVVFTFGAYLTVACDSVKNDPDYTGAVDSCSTECAAARTHQLDAICNGGAAASGASTVVSLAVVLSVCTSILVCIGFCNKKRRTVQPVIIMQQGGVQMQQMQQSQQWVQQNQQPQQMQQAQAVVVVPEVK